MQIIERLAEGLVLLSAYLFLAALVWMTLALVLVGLGRVGRFIRAMFT
jgi:hypothetical protein